MRQIFLTLLILFFTVASALADGTAPQVSTVLSRDMLQITFTVTGDASTGAISDQDTTDGRIIGMYLYRVIVENDSGDTSVTDNSDVYILDAGGTDLLNGKGVDQLDDDTRNYIRPCRHDPITGALTLDVNSQATASGVYIVTLIFAK